MENVSLHAHQGEFVAIVGLNGAGKTTLFNAVSGLLPYAGDIRRQGQSLRGRTAATIAREGIVQSPEGRELFGAMTVSENLDMGGQRLKEKDRAERREWLFDLFPILKERRTQTAATLSGGEQQMLTIARALMMKPDLLILDEPTLGLAPLIMEQISKALERLRQGDGHYRAPRRAERHLRLAPRRPRLRARTRPDRLGGESEPVRDRGRGAIFIGATSVLGPHPPESLGELHAHRQVEQFPGRRRLQEPFAIGVGEHAALRHSQEGARHRRGH